MLEKIHILVFLMLISIVALAQDNNKREYMQSQLRENAIEKSKWESATKDLDYSGQPISKKEDKKQEKKRRDYNNWERNSSGGSLSGGLAKFILIAAFAAVILVLLYNMSGVQLNFGGNQKIPLSESINLQEVEENLLESELDKLIKQAIAKGNYALAIRLYFLQAIKDMSIKNIIRWKKDKTNRDYLREMKSHPLSTNFKELSRVFDRVWYGQKPLSKEGFESIQPQFRNFLKAIQNG